MRKTNRSVHFWFRSEQKRGEFRPLLHPEHVRKLISSGHSVTVEHSKQRVIRDDEYEKIDGVKMVPEFSWKKASKDAVIVGLKELDSDENEDYPLIHKHIYFAHCFKGQKGSEKLLKRFKTGGGLLYDIEFLTNEKGVRVASFSSSAGKVGAALAARVWARQNTDSEKMPPIAPYYDSYETLTASIMPFLEKARARTGRNPSAIVIGALGRSGRGAVDILQSLGLNVVKWDMAETAKGGPFKEVLDNDILINCIYLNPKAPKSAPFLTTALIEQHQKDRKLSVIADVSCDTTNPNNPLPIYNTLTSFEKPTLTIFDKPLPLEMIAIDHLPSLVPKESTKDFTDQLIGHLEEFDQTPVWEKALNLFREKIATV